MIYITYIIAYIILMFNTHFDNTIFIPFIIMSNSIAETQQSKELKARIATHPEQKRSILIYDPKLAKVANDKAKDFAERGYFSHVTPEGFGPNYLVTQAGFILPAYYDDRIDANNIESIVNGTSTPEQTFLVLMNSPEHRVHILGEHNFYQKQTYYGIGYYEDSTTKQRYYWVILTAEKGSS